MNKKCFLILVFSLTIVTAKIKIKIKTGFNKGTAEVKTFGEDNKLITDAEVALFNITHENLNKGMKEEMGRIPDDIFLRDPTPYEDLFKMFEWQELRRNLKIAEVEILEIVNEFNVIKIFEHVNNSSFPLKINVDFGTNLENTIVSTWSKEGLPEDEIVYDIDVDLNSRRHIFTNRWRNNTVKSVLAKFGVKKDAHLDLNSGESMKVILSGFKTTILVKVTYVAKLAGQVICDYENLYGKYHFWAPSIESIMKAGNLTNEIDTTEHIEIRCYTNPKIKIIDNHTGNDFLVVKHFKPFRRKNIKVH